MDGKDQPQTVPPPHVDQKSQRVTYQQIQAASARKMLERMEESSGPIPDDVRDRIYALDWPD